MRVRNNMKASGGGCVGRSTKGINLKKVKLRAYGLRTALGVTDG